MLGRRNNKRRSPGGTAIPISPSFAPDFRPRSLLECHHTFSHQSLYARKNLLARYDRNPRPRHAPISPARRRRRHRRRLPPPDSGTNCSHESWHSQSWLCFNRKSERTKHAGKLRREIMRTPVQREALHSLTQLLARPEVDSVRLRSSYSRR